MRSLHLYCSVCPEPPNPWVVAGSILGGVVFLGLIILTLIKIIIYIISRREVKEWEKERNKTAITQVHSHLHSGTKRGFDNNSNCMIACLCVLLINIFANIA